jgi:hypothetical protein
MKPVLAAPEALTPASVFSMQIVERDSLAAGIIVAL